MNSARAQTLREEIANAISHGLGFLLAAASLPVLVVFSPRPGGVASVVGASVFSATMMLLYLASAVYHALPHGRLKRVFQRVDHAAIFLFIAGSYTPFLLGPLRGAWGWSLFGVVWGLAVLGIVAKIFDRLGHPLWSTAFYAGMGWLALVAIVPLMQHVGPEGMTLLFAGGAAYTVGALFFLLDDRVRYAHFVWHLFVMAGSTCHFFAALWHAPTA